MLAEIINPSGAVSYRRPANHPDVDEATTAPGYTIRMNPTEYAETRKSLGTQAEVSAWLGVARETIARRETGKDRITREAALALEALAKRPRNQRMPDAEGI